MTAPDILVARLERELGKDAVLVGEADRVLASADASRIPGACRAVVRPRDEGQVVALLRLASAEGLAVVPRGAGTSTTGSATPRAAEILLDLTRMDSILEVSGADLVAEVEPGVLTGVLQREAESRGLFYPPDPASSRFSTLGGNVATCAGGLRAVKYGVTRDYVLGIRAVLADGSVLETGGRSLKDVSGYDLVRLLVGSEGTLAVFTRLILRLLPLPPSSATLLASFPDESGGLVGADRVLAAGLLPRALEYLDREVLAITCNHRGIPVPEGVGSQLLLEFDGMPRQVEEEVQRAQVALAGAGAVAVRQAEQGQERDALWEARRCISPAVHAITPAKRSEDLGVPRGRLAEAIGTIKAEAREAGIRVLAYGHAGDANLHCNFLYDPSRPGDVEKLERAVEAARRVALGLGGTISGEHGIGLKKRAALLASKPPLTLALYRGIKRLFDPGGILNPGKLICEEETPGEGAGS